MLQTQAGGSGDGGGFGEGGITGGDGGGGGGGGARGGGGNDGRGNAGGDGGEHRGPQSEQSVPYEQSLYCAPAPPSSQIPSFDAAPPAEQVSLHAHDETFGTKRAAAASRGNRMAGARIFGAPCRQEPRMGVGAPGAGRDLPL